MKINKKCFAAVDVDGNILSHYEGYLISDNVKSLLQEMKIWAFCLPDAKIVPIKITKLDGEEHHWNSAKELEKRDKELYGRRKKK